MSDVLIEPADLVDELVLRVGWLVGGHLRRAPPVGARRMSPPVVVVLGPPGAGKGTQCQRLARTMGWSHVSLGDALHAEILRGSDLGAQVRPYVEAGLLAPDAPVIDLATRLLDHHGQHADGVLLDGFPRTLAQAEALAALAPEAVQLCTVLVLSREEVLARLRTRGRVDDRAAVVRERLLAYCRETKPVIRWYAQRGLVRYVDAHVSPPKVTAKLRALLRNELVRA